MPRPRVIGITLSAVGVLLKLYPNQTEGVSPQSDAAKEGPFLFLHRSSEQKGKTSLPRHES